MSYLEIYNDLIFDLLATLPVDSGSDCSTPDQPKPLNIAEVHTAIMSTVIDLETADLN